MGGARLRQSSVGFSRPLRISKEISAIDGCVQMGYMISNLADKPTAFLYACHPLLAVDQGDIVLLPDEVASVSLNYSSGEQVGRPGDWVPWPQVEMHDRDLRVVLPYTANTAEMLYSRRLTNGWAAVYRTSIRQGIVVRFRTEALPYLGVWLCYGGWPEGAGEPRQYAIALEPTTAPYGTLSEAAKRGTAIELAPQGEFRFEIAFCVSHRDLSRESFRKFCEGNDNAC